MHNTVTDRKIRTAIVGCGRISKNHFGSIATHADSIELVSVCDIDQQTLEGATTEHGVKGYRHLNDMLQQEQLDLVVLCTPSGLHSMQAQKAAKYKVNVMTEKPMATRWHDGVNMVKACDEGGARLFVVKQNRSNATLQLLKSAVEKERFGRIYMVNINVFWTRPQEYYDSAKWRGTWEFDGGAFMNRHLS